MHCEKILITLVFVALVQGAPSDDKKDNGRIVGGYPINISQRPFQVALYTNGGFCGGSIIGPNKVLTAAHCVYRKAARDLIVYVGSSVRNSGGYIHYVSRVAVHPSYSRNTNDCDVAVLTTSVSFRYSSNIAPVGLLSNRPSAGTDAVVSGWGTTRSGASNVETYLREVHVPIVDQAACRRQYARTSTITDRMVCAGLSAGGRDSCQGDSGGPLTANGGLAGVVSFGRGCALPGYAGIYASVPELRPWIISQ